MTAENPFAEPEDGDRTVIRPVPGGRRTRPQASAVEQTIVSPRRPAAPTRTTHEVPPSPAGTAPLQASSGPAAPDVDVPATGASPLLAAAAPLLQLLPRLCNILTQPDPGVLRANAIRALNEFEKAGRAASIPVEQLRPAHYALCASLDDVVLNTPWGTRGAWAARSLAATFHQEARSGERFFDLLAQTRRNAATQLPLRELLYYCMSRGFIGRYRGSPQGLAEFARLRSDVHAQIHRQRNVPAALSPHWQGASAPYRPKRNNLPIWVAAVAGAACVGGLFAWLSSGLNQLSDALYERALASPPALMPQIARAAPVEPPKAGPAAADATTLDKLREVLKPEIEQGLVTVTGTEAVPVVRIAANSMFAPRAATVLPRFAPMLTHIGNALKNEQGSIDVVGYTDNQPVRMMEFPSNFQLSAARARAAAALIAKGIGEAGRLHAEGRADADPIASNTTLEGRERNRRIELILHRPAAG